MGLIGSALFVQLTFFVLYENNYYNEFNDPQLKAPSMTILSYVKNYFFIKQRIEPELTDEKL
jgi:hypothetical protein